MGKIFSTIKTAVYLTYLKIRYLSHFKGNVVQCFDKVKIKILNGGNISVGSKNQNRGNMYIICDNGKLEIGSHCFFNINASITAMEHIHIGNRCTFGNNLVIVDHDHDFKNPVGGFKKGSVYIGDNVWVGADVVILKDTWVGNNCIIAAGSIVRGRIEPNTLLIQKRITEYREV